MMVAPLNKSPRKTIELGAVYDASATTNEADFGQPIRGFEDYHFAPSIRSTTIGRFRSEVRNNAFLAGLVEEFPGAIGRPEVRQRTPDADFNSTVDRFIRLWGNMVTPERDSLHTVKEILWREMLIAGEIFAVLRPNGKIQLITSELCGSRSIAGQYAPRENGEYEMNGVVYNRSGTPIAYLFGKLNGYGLVDFSEPVEIPARFVIHVWRKDRVLMGRGLPWLLASLRPARDLYEICRSKTKQIKDANQISGAIEKDGAADWMDKQSELPDESNAAAEDENSPADRDTDEPITIKLTNGTFIGLEPGEKLHQLMSEYRAEDYKELIFILLHQISCPIGLPVELWFSGVGDVSYSGYKGLGTLWIGRRRRYQNFAKENFLDRLIGWRLAKATKESDVPPHPTGQTDLWEFRWREPQVLDDEKTAKANETRLKTGEVGVEDIWEELGYSPEEIFAKRRATYISLMKATGKIPEDADEDGIEVPELYLLRGLLPEEMKNAAAVPTEPPEEPEEPPIDPEEN
ncbi:MAG: phage portal protein [Verrucomicrobiota bacterium]